MLLEVVELQADRVGSGCLEAVEDAGDVTVRKTARGFDEYCLLIGTVSDSFVKNGFEFQRERCQIRDRTHILQFIELQRSIGIDRHHQRERVWTKIAISLRHGRQFCEKAMRLERRCHHKDDEQNKQHVDQRSYINTWRGNNAFGFAHLHTSTAKIADLDTQPA